MSALLYYLFNAADPAPRFQIAKAVYRHDHDHPNAQDVFLAYILPSAEKAARRKAEKLFGHPSDWQVELMYDGAVAAAIEMFQLHPPLSTRPHVFPTLGQQRLLKLLQLRPRCAHQILTAPAPQRLQIFLRSRCRGQ
jgi:hypothetical protein